MASNEARKVEPLKKVALLLEAGKGEDRLDFTPEPIPLVLIFGIGMWGLSPLELALAGKTEGDACLLRLEARDLPEFFQHALIPPLGIPETGEPFTLKISIARVSTPDQRELIRAVADMANCGSHCCGH